MIERQKKDTYSLLDKEGKFKKGFAEINSGEVLTIENEAYTIREMLDKFVTGVFNPQSVNLNLEEIEYTDDMMNSEVPEIIDRVDAQEYVDSIENRKKRRENALRKAETKKAVEPQKKDELAKDADQGSQEP